MCVREIRGMEKWRCWDERGRVECGLCGMRGRDREKRDGCDRYQEEEEGADEKFNKCFKFEL